MNDKECKRIEQAATSNHLKIDEIWLFLAFLGGFFLFPPVIYGVVRGIERGTSRIE